MDEKILVLVYPGLGKTWVAENFANVIDFEQQHYTFIYDDDIKDLPLEQIKSDASKRRPNPDWPNNFISGVNMALKSNDIVITTFIPKVYKAILSADYQNVRIILATFNHENFEELAERFRARGNSEDFVERRRADFSIVNQLLQKDKTNEKIIVESGEYLASALIKYGVKLLPGKGQKNYI